MRFGTFLARPELRLFIRFQYVYVVKNQFCILLRKAPHTRRSVALRDESAPPGMGDRDGFAATVPKRTRERERSAAYCLS